MNIDFEQAKQKVAETCGFPNWDITMFVATGPEQRVFQEWQKEYISKLCQHFFELGATESVIDDRAAIKTTCVHYSGEHICLDLQAFDTLPLPFEEKI